MRRAAAGLALGLLAAPATAPAEMLVAALSDPVVEISSNFTGTTIAVFGAVERDSATVSRTTEGYDIVVVVTGPRRSFVVRRKERLLGLWANRDARTFVAVPSFYAVSASRPLADLAIPATLKRQQIGLEHLVFPEAASDMVDLAGNPADFREAFLRLQHRAGLYSERTGAVEFLSQHLFRTYVPLPANVPIGKYLVEIFLFQGSVLLASTTTELSVKKSGFEQSTFDLAVRHGWAYGLATVALAIVVGWLAGVIFRRD